ncbi:hypothetical protein ABIE44_001685 [Marmoricola sp. OAE513]|uniref:hypothetical protein n=1 Tax=Marmoricola sp. OAE513 TaxID=2817894 RepID=UPI001AE43E83
MRKSLVVVLTTLALVLGFGTLADAATAKKSFKVSIKSNVAVSQAGRFIVISGKVSGPGAGGKKVKVQRQYIGGAWITVATVTTKKSGKYKAVVETPRGGTTSFRALKAKSSARKAGVSATKALPVYQWLDLATQPGQLNNTFPVQEQVGGTLYEHAFSFSQGGGMAYRPSGLCTEFATRFGYKTTGQPPVADDANLELTRIQTNPAPSISTSTSVSTGNAVTFTSSLAGTKYLTIEVTSIAGGGSYFAALGDPKVYCNASTLPTFRNGDF